MHGNKKNTTNPIWVQEALNQIETFIQQRLNQVTTHESLQISFNTHQFVNYLTN